MLDLPEWMVSAVCSSAGMKRALSTEGSDTRRSSNFAGTQIRHLKILVGFCGPQGRSHICILWVLKFRMPSRFWVSSDEGNLDTLIPHRTAGVIQARKPPTVSSLWFLTSVPSCFPFLSLWISEINTNIPIGEFMVGASNLKMHEGVLKGSIFRGN